MTQHKDFTKTPKELSDAEALTRAMKRYPDMVDYLREMNRIAARFDAKRDPVSKNWVLPHGVTVSLEDLQAAYEGKP